MNDIYEEMNRLIRNKFAPDIADCLRAAEVPYLLVGDMNSIRVPLLATPKLIYDKGFGDFVVTASLRENDAQPFNCTKSVFSTRELLKVTDKAAFVEYIFEQLKRDFLKRLAMGEIEKQIAEYSKEGDAGI